MCSVTGESDDNDDKIVVETFEFEPPRELAEVPVRAKGTRQQVPLVRPPDTPIPPARGTRDLEDVEHGRANALGRAHSHTREPMRIPTVRDPIAVLKTWPVSTEPAPDTSTARPRATLRAPSPGPHLDDKIKLAHLALDLYHELEGLQPLAPGARALHHGHRGDCEDPTCEARANVLRGALVEACLLVQRIAMTASPRERDEVDARLRDLLALIEH